MADVEQRGGAGDSELAVARARFDHAVAVAEWVSQEPPSSDPQTTERTFNEIVGEIVGELRRIQACYALKQAADYLQDTIVMNALADDNLAQETKKRQEEAQSLLNCPPMK